MQTFLFAIGAIAAAVGVFTIGFGIEVYDFSFGNTLIVAGTTSLTGGLIVVGLAAAVRELGRIADAVSARPSARGAIRTDAGESPKIGYRGGQGGRSVPAPRDNPEVATPNPRSGEPRSTAARSGGGLDEHAARQRQNVFPLVRPAAESMVSDDIESISLSPREATRVGSARVETTDLARAELADPIVSDLGIGDIHTFDVRPDLRANGPRISDVTTKQSTAGQVASKSSGGSAAVARSSGVEDLFRETEPLRAMLAAERLATERSKRVDLFDAVWPAGSTQGAAFSKEAVARQLTSEPLLTHERVEPISASSPSHEDGQPPRSLDAPHPVSVLKSGVIDGMAYTLYTDGSIEAQLSQNTMRFDSIHELRQHLQSIS